MTFLATKSFNYDLVVRYEIDNDQHLDSDVNMQSSTQAVAKFLDNLTLFSEEMEKQN